MRPKALFVALCTLCLLLTATACQSDPEPAPAEPLIYYNEQLALSITVPPEWQINALGQDSGSHRLELLDAQNKEDSADPEHCRFYAYAEIFDEPQETEPYLDLFTELLSSPAAPYSYEIQKREQVELARHTAQRIYVQVSISGSEQTYAEEYYIVPLGPAFVIFYINYWPQNEVSRAAAYAMLDNIDLP